MGPSCPHCGAALPAVADAFCPECRSPLDAPPPAPSWPPRPAEAIQAAPDAGPRLPAPARPRAWRDLLVLLAYYGLAALWGARNAYAWQPSLLDLLVPLALSWALARWAFADAAARGRPLPELSRHWFFLLALVLVPAYVVRSRGGRGLLLVVLHAVLGSVVWRAAADVVRLAVFGTF
jgi:hypothetical protein